MQDGLTAIACFEAELDWLEKLLSLAGYSGREQGAYQAPKCFTDRDGADTVVPLSKRSEGGGRQPGGQAGGNTGVGQTMDEVFECSKEALMIVIYRRY